MVVVPSVRPKVSEGTIIAEGMLRQGTPIEYYKAYNLYVKREDLSCPPPGPPFSKTRGVYAHVKSRPEEIIGVLDTFHSQAGHAVARACQILGKGCYNFYPEYKNDPGYREPQRRAAELGALLYPLPAGRSCILYHQAKKMTEGERGGYMMPNALKLSESVTETAKEVPDSQFDVVIIPASSGTIAAGVVRGFCERKRAPRFIVHLGYSRSGAAVVNYINEAAGRISNTEIIDEGYAYKDRSKSGETPPWPCNAYYDLKAFRWYLANRETFSRSRVLFWNVG